MTANATTRIQNWNPIFAHFTDLLLSHDLLLRLASHSWWKVRGL
jgi:hypothetical protein